MADDSRVVIQFVGSDAGLTATAGEVNQQLGAAATSATALKTKLGEATTATKAYGEGLKAAATDAEKLFQTTAKLTAQRVAEGLKAEAEASRLVAAALKAQQDEAEKLFQTNARLTAQKVKEALNEQAKAAKSLALANAEAGRASKELQSVLAGFGAGLGLAAFQAISNAVVQLPQQILGTTLAFEKFHTVLTTLYGDAGKADVAFGKLQSFAATTPFQLDQVVESFIKLKNRGIDPTKKVLTELGDIASSQGKSLDQITEAILDAQTSQFERLKEFGINASAAGDKVIFTFKGITQTVEKTPEAIAAAILKMGEFKGVAGGMEAQSKTLGGQLSNLQDGAAAIAVAFGDELIPVLKEFVGGLNASSGSATDLAREAGQNVAAGLQLLGGALKFVVDNAKLFEIILQLLIVRMVALRAIALYDMLVKASAGFIAAGTAATGATGGVALLTGAMRALQASLLASLPLLLAVGGAVAVIQTFQFVDSLVKANEALEVLQKTTYVQGGATQSLAGNTKQLTAALSEQIKKTGELSAAQKNQAENQVKLNQLQLEDLKKQREAAEKTPVAQPGFLGDVLDTVTSGEIGLDGSFKKNDSAGTQNNTRKAAIADLNLQITSLEKQTSALKKATGATGEDTEAVKKNTAAKNDPKAIKAAATAKAAAAKEEDQDAKAAAEQAHQDELQRQDQEYQDAKALRAQKFQDAQQVIDRRNQQAKEDRAAAFQDAQALVDRRNQDEKQARQTAYDEAKQKASDARDEAKTKRSDTLKDSQTDAGKQLSLEGSRGNARTNLLNQGATTAAVDKLSDEDLRGENGKALEPEQLAALAKKTAGVSSINNARDEERAQFALKAIAARQDKLQKELDRKEDEAYKAKVKKEDAAFKVAQEVIDDAKALEKKKAARAEKEAEQKLDDRIAKDKQDAIRKETARERDLDRQHTSDQREADRTFKADQRTKDRENAAAVKKILEDTKIPAPATPAPVPRFLGGHVSPGVLYLGGEQGTEGIDFGGGRRATVGENGAQLFQVARSGYVHPAGSAFTQQVMQATFNQPSASKAVGAVGGSTVVVATDDAMLKELRSLRAEVQRMRPINQQFDISEEYPLDKVHSAMKYAARLR